MLNVELRSIDSIRPYDRNPRKNDAAVGELKDLGLDLSLLGWDASELAEIMAPPGNAGLVDEDEVPEPPGAAVTQPGDVWVLGRHRLLCGDSADPGDVDRLLNGAPIHLVNTDPPYNVKVEPRSNNAIAAGLSSFAPSESTHHQKFDVERHPEKAKGTTQKVRAKDRPLANDFVSDDEFDRLLAAWFGNISRVLIPGGGFYVWGGTPTSGTTPRRSRTPGSTSRSRSCGTNSTRCSPAKTSWGRPGRAGKDPGGGPARGGGAGPRARPGVDGLTSGSSDHR